MWPVESEIFGGGLADGISKNILIRPGVEAVVFSYKNHKRTTKGNEDTAGYSICKESRRAVLTVQDGIGGSDNPQEISRLVVETILKNFRSRAGKVTPLKLHDRAHAELQKANGRLKGGCVGATLVLDDAVEGIQLHQTGDPQFARYLDHEKLFSFPPYMEMLPQNAAYLEFRDWRKKHPDADKATLKERIHYVRFPRDRLSRAIRTVLNTDDPERHYMRTKNKLDFKPGDWFFACSDGVALYDQRQDLKRKFKRGRQPSHPSELAEYLLEYSNEFSNDNASGIILHRTS